jgi:CPA2 family monovalent cation:H+ antiporter-2
VSAGLAQIGEFSFILVGLGITLKLLPAEARDLILAGSIFSIALNPLIFAAIPRLVEWFEARPRLLAVLQRKSLVKPEPHVTAEGLSDHAVIVGHGVVGRTITPALEKACLPFVVIERDRPRLDALRARGIPAIFGDATVPRVLTDAGIERARLLIVATPDSFQARRVIELARAANPRIEVIVRTHSERETQKLKSERVGHVILGERELARTMLQHALWHFDVPADRSSPLLDDQDDNPRKHQ